MSETESPGDVEDDKYERGAWIPCPSCRAVLIPDDKAFDAHFDGDDLSCPNCKTIVPLWHRILEWTRDWFVFGDPLVFAGARFLHVKESLRKNEVKEIDLTKHGVPADAEVLYLNLTSAI